MRLFIVRFSLELKIFSKYFQKSRTSQSQQREKGERRKWLLMIGIHAQHNQKIFAQEEKKSRETCAVSCLTSFSSCLNCGTSLNIRKQTRKKKINFINEVNAFAN